MAASNPGAPMIDISSLPPDLAMMRIENDNIQMMAVASPRDLEKVKQDILGQLKVFPAIAEDLIYTKPVGKDDDGEMQFARNLSVRAAEMLAEAYGYNRVAAKTTIIDADHVQVEATFVDYQRGRIWTESKPVSRSYKRKGGGTAFHPEDRFLNIVCQAERSKVIREAILRCVPPGLKQSLFEAADKQMSKLLTDEAMDKIVKSFATKSVTVEQLEHLIGRTRKKGWTIEDRQRLAELWRAIETDEATVEEIFGARPGEPSNAASGNGHGKGASGEVTAEHLLNPQGAAEETPSKEETPPKNPRGQVGPDKPAAEDANGPRLERDEEADQGDDGSADEPPLPDWANRLEIELAAADGIRAARAIGAKYLALDGLEDEDKDWINDVVAQAEDRVRQGRAGRGAKPQQGDLLGG